jgi:hypothetical protein
LTGSVGPGAIADSFVSECPNVSPDVKQLLINGLIHEQMSHSETNESAIAPGPTEPVNSVQTGSLWLVSEPDGESITSFHFFFKALYLYMHCWYVTLQLRVSKSFSDTCFHNTT